MYARTPPSWDLLHVAMCMHALLLPTKVSDRHALIECSCEPLHIHTVHAPYMVHATYQYMHTLRTPLLNENRSTC